MYYPYPTSSEIHMLFIPDSVDMPILLGSAWRLCEYPCPGSLESELCGSGETVRISPHGVAYLVRQGGQGWAVASFKGLRS